MSMQPLESPLRKRLRFIAAYNHARDTGVFDKDRSVLHDFQETAKANGYTLEPYVSPRLQQALATARAGIAEQGVAPAMTKAQGAGAYDPNKDPTLPANTGNWAKAADTAQAVTGSAGAIPMMAYSRFTGDPGPAIYAANALKTAPGAFFGAAGENIGPGALAGLGAALSPPHPLWKAAGGLAGFGLGELLKPGVQQALMGPKTYQQYQESLGQGAKAHPILSTLGGITGAVAGGGVPNVVTGIRGIGKGIGAARSLINPTARAALRAVPGATAKAVGDAAAPAVGGAIPAGIDIIDRIRRGEPISLGVTAANLLGGALLHGDPYTGEVPQYISDLAAGRNVFSGVGGRGPTSIMGGTGEFVPPPAPPGQASPIMPPEPTYVGGVHRPSVQYHPVTGQPIVGQPVHPVTGAPASPLESEPTPIPRPGQPLGEPHPLTGPSIEESLGNYYGNPSVSPLNLQPQPAPTPYNPLLPQEFQMNAAGVPQPNAEFPYTGIAPQGTPPTPPSGPAGIETVRPTPAVSTATPTPSGIEPVRPLPPAEPAPVQAKRGRPAKPVEQKAAVPVRGGQVETPNGVGTYTSKGTDTGKKDGKPVIWVMHPGDEKSTMYPVDQVDVVNGKFTREKQTNAAILEQSGVRPYDPNDPTSFGPKTPKQAQDVVDLLSGVKESDLNPTQKQHLIDARKILAQKQVFDAAQQKLQEGSGGAEHQGGKSSGQAAKTSGSNRPVSTAQGVQPIAPVQPGQGTTPVAPVAETGTTPAANAAPAAPVVATAPAAPAAKGSVKAKTTVTAPAATGKVVQTASAEAGKIPATAPATEQAPTPINGNPPAATVPAATPTPANASPGALSKGDSVWFYERANSKNATPGKIVEVSKNIPTGNPLYVIRYTKPNSAEGTMVLNSGDSRLTRATQATTGVRISPTAKSPAIVPGSEDHAAALLRMSDSIKPQIAKSKNPNAVSETNQAVQDAIAAWDKDPNDANARLKLNQVLQKHGVDPVDASKFSSELQGFLRSSRPNLGASLFGGSNITSAITRFRGAQMIRKKWAETPTTDPLLIDPNTPHWDASDLVNLPQSVTSPTGVVHQEGMIERNLGPKGAQATQIMVKTSRDIDAQKLEAKQRLDQVHAFLEAGRRKLGGSRLDSAATKSKFNATFTKYIEMTPAERAAQDATGKVPQEIQTAVKEYDKYTQWMKEQLYDYQKNILKRENMPDIKDWGISDAGYFHHSMFKDFTANMKDAAGKDYPLSADTYGELLHNIEQHQKAFGTTLDTVSGRENRVYDPTVRINQGKFWKLVEDVSKSPGVDANGRRILSRDDVLGDMTGKIGMKASKSEFISSLMKRAGAEGYENDAWRYVMNRYSDNAIEGINITKMRLQLQPLAEEIGRTDQQGQKYLESKTDMVAGKPTDAELKQANFIHRMEIQLGIPGYSPNPMRSLRNLASAIQGTTFYATLGTRPAATWSNELQRYTTLFPRIGAKAMARAEVAAVAPKNVEMMRDLGILDGEYRIVNNNGTLQAVLYGKSKLRLANPVEAFRNASQRNRAVGFMHGYNSIMDAMNAGQLKPDGTKFTREDAISEGHNFATLTEFKNNNFYTPDILKTPAGGIAFQYQGYTINNLKQWKDAVVRLYSPSLRAKGGISQGEAWAQIGRKTGAQVATGGLHSLAPILFTAGTYFWLKDHGFPEHLSRTVAFGAPATAGVDMSGMTAPIPDVLGNAAPAVQMLGPGVSSAVRLGQGAYQDYSKGTFPEQTLRAVPIARQANAAYSILTGKPIYYSIRGMKDGELTKLTDKLIVLAGGLPFEMTESRAEAEAKRTRKNPGPSVDDLIRTAPKPLVPASPAGTPSPPR